jgi:putative transposase
MKRSRFTEEQIVSALQEAEAGANVKELCRRLGISRETLYNWKRKYGGMNVPDAKRLKQLEDENRQLKRIVADQAVNVQVLKDLLGNRL